MSTVVVGAMLAPPPAQAAVGAARTVLVSANEGIVIVEGLADDQEATIEVRRGSVLVASVTAAPAEFGIPNALEVNHLADPTLCWDNTSPEILPGDQVRVVGNGSDPANTFTDTVDVVALGITQEVTQVDADSATVKGFVGTPRPDIALLDVFLRATAGVDFRRNAAEAPNDIAYDVAGDVNDGAWTATFNGLTQAQIDAAQNPRVLEAIYTRAANEILTAPPGAGPLPPEDPACPPLASRAVTSIDKPVVSIANRAGGLTVQGVTSDASQVHVSIPGAPTRSVTPTPPSGTGQTWTASWTDADLAGAEGTLTVSATHDVTGGTVPGRSMTFVRDVTAPEAPTISPAGGTHDNSVDVSIAAPEPGATIFYTTDGTQPTPASTRYTGPFTRTSSTTVRAIAVDRVGNPGAVAQSQLTVATPPGAPTSLVPRADDATATLTWAPGPDHDRPVQTYTVRAVTGGEEPRVVTVPASTTSHTFTGLTNGAPYTLSVRATNSAGDGPFATAGPVTPLGPPAAPTGVTARPLTGAATVDWVAPTSTGGTPVTGYRVRAYQDGALVSETAFGASQTQGTVPGLTDGTLYTFRVVAENAVGSSPESAASATVRPEAAPLAPSILAGRDGRPGRAVTATARWLPPQASTATVTGYVVQAWKVRRSKRPVLRGEAVVASDRRSTTMHLPAGSYRFRVRAVGLVAEGPWSARSPRVSAR